MNKGMIWPAALLLGAALVQPAAAATTSTNLSVTATVTPNCTVASTPVAFGSVNPIGGVNVDATGTFTVTCTNGTPWAASANAGTGSGATLTTRKMTAGANTLNYAIFTDNARTTVWGDGTGATATIANSGNGSGQTTTVYGRVPAGQNTVPPGSYADTVSVTVTY